MDYEIENKHHTAFERPNYTQTPNSLFDELMKDMGEAELKVTLCIIRKIVGYHKFKPEAVSLSQIQAMTGLSRQGAIDGLEQAIKRGVIKRAGTGKRGVALFQIVHSDDQSTNQTSSGQDSRPVTGQDSRHTKEKKKKESKENNIALQAPSDSKQKPFYDAIKALFNIDGGRNANMQKMLEGIAKDSQHKPYNLSPAMGLDEFLQWAKYAESLGEFKPIAPQKVQSSIMTWREKKAKPVQAPKTLSQRKAPANLDMLATEKDLS